MYRDRKWLEGEVKFVEGKTVIKHFLKTLATELVTQQWIPYDKNPTDPAWTFDLRREVWLPASFKPENIRIYKATINEETNLYEKGELIDDNNYQVIKNIIRGIGGNDSGTNISDTIFIEVNYEAEEFQRATFLPEQLPSGEIKNVAKLKSRPRGRIKLFKDTIQIIEGEELHQTGADEFYKFSMTPVSDSNDVSHKLKVYKNGEVVDSSEYVVDYFNGMVLFNKSNEKGALITADYGCKVGTRLEEIPEEKYILYDNRIIDNTPDGELEGLDIIVDVDYYWELHYPERISDIDNSDRIVLKTSVDISTARNWSKIKAYYWELQLYDKLLDEEKYLTGVKSRFGSTLDEEDPTTLDDKLSSEWAKWSWYCKEGFKDGVVYDEWLPIRYYISFTQEHANIVLQGDPSPDIHPYDNYLISYAYIGMLQSYKGAKKEDLEHNFGMTVSSDEHPLAPSEYHTTWGQRTGTGVTDIVMEKTASNIPYQAHDIAFHTTPEFMDKHFILVSEFTGSHHFSEITVVHAYERERGKLQDVLIGDRSSIFHLDELISNKDTYDFRGAMINEENNFKNPCGKPIESKEKRWLMFNIKAPYSILQKGSNVHYGIAIRKS